MIRPAGRSVLIAVLTLFTSVIRAQNNPDDQKVPFDHFSGEIRSVYRFRGMEGDNHDSDFYEYWSLCGNDFFDDRFDTYFSGRLQKDLDGTTHSLAVDPFVSVEDLDTGWNDHIYQLYGDLHTQDADHGLRLGRQYIDWADSLQVDGGEMRLFQNERFKGRLFLGQPVGYYSPTADDIAGGLSLEGRILEGSRGRIAYARYEDESRDENDDWIALDYWQRITDNLRSHSRCTFLDNDLQTAGEDLIYLNTERDFDAVFNIRRWDGLKQESRWYSPIYTVLGEMEPYTYVSARCTKGLLPWLMVSPGAAGRFVDNDDQDIRNREYGRYDLTFIIEPVRNWTVALSGEYWDVNNNDEFYGLSGEVQYRRARLWEAALGTARVDYQYHQESLYGYTDDGGDVVGHYDGDTYYTTQTSPDAYSFYGRLRINISKHVSVRINGEIEDNSVEDDLLYGVRTSLAIRF